MREPGNFLRVKMNPRFRCHEDIGWSCTARCDLPKNLNFNRLGQPSAICGAGGNGKVERERSAGLLYEEVVDPRWLLDARRPRRGFRGATHEEANARSSDNSEDNEDSGVRP